MDKMKIDQLEETVNNLLTQLVKLNGEITHLKEQVKKYKSQYNQVKDKNIEAKKLIRRTLSEINHMK